MSQIKPGDRVKICGNSYTLRYISYYKSSSTYSFQKDPILSPYTENDCLVIAVNNTETLNFEIETPR